MKLKAFLQRMPEPFAVEVLEALPAPDRRELLRKHGAKVAVSAGSLKRATRIAKEARILVKSLLESEDADEARTFLQGWLARRAEMVVHFLDAWKVKHQGGIVEDFDWVQKLEPDAVKASIEGLGGKVEPIAPLVYFAYLELPITEQVVDIDALFKTVEQGAPSA